MPEPATPDHVGPLPAPPSSYTFTATHLTAGNSRYDQQLLYGWSDSLSSPVKGEPERPQSSVKFDMYGRTVNIEAYCDRCVPCRVDSADENHGYSRKSMWPFKATIPWEDLQTRGMRLDLSDAPTNSKYESIFNLRINLRRPPILWYEPPPALRFNRGRDTWHNGMPPRVYERRSTEEDYIALPTGTRLGQGMEDGKRTTVLGLPTKIAFFKPGNWLSYQISLRLDAEEVKRLDQLLADLRLTLPVSHTYADTAEELVPDSVPLPDNPQSLLSSIFNYPFPIRYLYEGLLSYSIVAPEDLTTLTTHMQSVPDSQEKREKLLASLFSMGKISGRIVPVIDDLYKKLAACPPAKPLRQHVVLVRRAIVTPTRLLLLPPAEETSNHVLREHVQHIDRFLRVQFADENDNLYYKPVWDDKQPSASGFYHRECPGKGMVDRIRRVLDGGLRFAGRDWVFLAAGGSQLKERQAWFVCEDPKNGFTAQAIRDWMGAIGNERTIARHCARISQSFSTTREVKVKLSIKKEEDIQFGQYTFTDGVGRTSQALVTRAAQTLLGDAAFLARYSAVQIRIGGAKGMLAAWPSMKANEVVLRKSMLKYESPHEKFGAVMIAGYSPAFLNRQAILLMEALGTPEDAILAAFNSQLARVDNLVERASDERKHPEFDMTSFPIQKLFAAGLGADAFVFDTVKLLQTALLWDLKWKARIKVEKGVYLFGVADELGVLNENEVFCAYADPKNKDNHGVVEGDCIITRAPSLHPGDVRRVKAVAHPKLVEAGLVNVIIFPTKGRRDLANQLAGGDLDGDMFTLVWDPALLIAKNEEPSPYIPPQEPRLVDKVQTRHIKKWFIDYFKGRPNDVLGQISMAHMAIADREGPRHPSCIHLAQLASYAVDFQKTGVPVRLPRELKQEGSKRPDFMGPTRNPEDTYESQRILGKMFRLVEKEPSFIAHSDIKMNPVLAALKVPDEFLLAAWRLKLKYELDLVGFMRQYMLSELEVVTGLVTGQAVPADKRKNMMRDDALKLSIRDAFQVQLLEVNQREAAEWSETKPCPPGFYSSAEAFAVAAYHIVYSAEAREIAELEEDELTVLNEAVGESQKRNADGTKAAELFSFCWMWADELADALFRRVGHPLPDPDALKDDSKGKGSAKRKRGASVADDEGFELDYSGDNETDADLGPRPFAAIPDRWKTEVKRKRTKTRNATWINDEDELLDQFMYDDSSVPAPVAPQMENAEAGPSGASWDEEDEQDESSRTPSVIDLLSSDGEDASDGEATYDDDGDDDAPMPGPEDDDDEVVEILSSDNEDEDDAYRSNPDPDRRSYDDQPPVTAAVVDDIRFNWAEEVEADRLRLQEEEDEDLYGDDEGEGGSSGRRSMSPRLAADCEGADEPVLPPSPGLPPSPPPASSPRGQSTGFTPSPTEEELVYEEVEVEVIELLSSDEEDGDEAEGGPDHLPSRDDADASEASDEHGAPADGHASDGADEGDASGGPHGERPPARGPTADPAGSRYASPLDAGADSASADPPSPRAIAIDDATFLRSRALQDEDDDELEDAGGLDAEGGWANDDDEDED